jgi:hypothetical protein
VFKHLSNHFKKSRCHGYILKPVARLAKTGDTIFLSWLAIHIVIPEVLNFPIMKGKLICMQHVLLCDSADRYLRNVRKFLSEYTSSYSRKQ